MIKTVFQFTIELQEENERDTLDLIIGLSADYDIQNVECLSAVSVLQDEPVRERLDKSATKIINNEEF